MLDNEMQVQASVRQISLRIVTAILSLVYCNTFVLLYLRIMSSQSTSTSMLFNSHKTFFDRRLLPWITLYFIRISNFRLRLFVLNFTDF